MIAVEVGAWVGHIEWACDVGDHPLGDLAQIREEGPEIADGAQLHGEAEAIVIAAPAREQLPIGRVEIEVARQHDVARVAVEARVGAHLSVGEKFDRHAALPPSFPSSPLPLFPSSPPHTRHSPVCPHDILHTTRTVLVPAEYHPLVRPCVATMPRCRPRLV